MFLLFVIVQAGDVIPQNQELNLPMWAEHPMEENHIISIIPSKEVIHENKEPDDAQLLHRKPAKQA